MPPLLRLPIALLLLALLAYGLLPLYTQDRHISAPPISLIPPQAIESDPCTPCTYILPLDTITIQPDELADGLEGELPPSRLPAEALRGEIHIRLTATEQGDIRVSADTGHLRLHEQATLTPPRLRVRCELAEDEWGEDIVEDVQGGDTLLSFTLHLNIDVEEIFFRHHELQAHYVLTLDLASQQLYVEYPDGSLSPALERCDD